MAIVKEIRIDANANIESNLDEFGNEAVEAASDVDKLVESLDEMTKQSKKADEAAEKRAKDLKAANESAAKSTGKISKGFKAVGTAIKAAGIGLVIGLFVTMKEILGQNQTVLDFFSTTMTTINIVVNEAVDVFKDVFDSVSESTDGFDALGKVMSGVLTLVITPFKIAFDGIRLVIANAQLAWEESVFGGKDADKILELQANVDRIKDSLRETGQAALDAGSQIVDNFVEAFEEISEATTAVVSGLAEIDIAASKLLADQITARKNAAILAEEINKGLIEQADVLAELQRQIRDDESKSIAERTAANEELGRVLEQQSITMQENAALVVQAAQDQLSLNDNIENRVALQAALNEQDAISARVTGFQSEQLVNKIALEKEARELTTAQTAADNARAIQAEKFNAAQLEGFQERYDALNLALQHETDIETARLELLINSLAEGTQAKIDAQIELDDFNETQRQANLELEKAYLDDGLDATQKSADGKKQIEDLASGATTATLNSLANLSSFFAGESEKEQQKSFKIQKAASIAGATIATYQSAISAFATQQIAGEPTSFARGLVAAGIATATGLANVAKISQQKFESNVSSAPSAPSLGGLSGGSSNAPSFNVVGQTSNDANQITDAIGSANTVPIKAFVVGKEMTSQQEMDRNLEDSASI